MAGFHQSHMCLFGLVCLYDRDEAFVFCRHFSDVGQEATDAMILHTVDSGRKVLLAKMPADITNNLSKSPILVLEYHKRIDTFCFFDRRCWSRGQSGT